MIDYHQINTCHKKYFNEIEEFKRMTKIVLVSNKFLIFSKSTNYLV